MGGWGEGGELAQADCGVVGEQEDPLGAVPEGAEGLLVFKDLGAVWPEAAEPWAIDAAIDQVDGLARVEEER